MTTHPSIRLYILIFITLAALTVITVAVSYLHLPVAPAIALAILIATLKASLVAAYFMHLRFEKVLIIWLLGVTVLFMLVLFILPITAFQGFTPSSHIGNSTSTETHNH
jgi:cytochrome c oxidase subunit 4